MAVSQHNIKNSGQIVDQPKEDGKRITEVTKQQKDWWK